MKNLPMTPELSQLIKNAVGEDVDTANLTVFETIALNNKPLPGKRGTIFENAVVETVTLAQMVDHINSGKHLPLIADHELFGAPKGRFFHAGLNIGSDNELELRALFYLDSTEETLITKLNSGSLDEVSVSFLSTQFLCSECSWDYFQFGDRNNIDTRTCENGHTLGEDGVHARMIGLNQFIELSLVARGAADNPKIVGRSASKLAPETAYRLAANGFVPDELVVQASMKEEITMADPNTQLMQDLVAAKTEVATLTMGKTTAESQVTTLTATIATKDGEIASLTADLAAANAKIPDDYDAVKAENGEAVAALQAQVNALLTATGKDKLEGDALPTKVADLKAKIEDLTAGLTAIIPVGGRSKPATGSESDVADLAFNPSAFSVRK